MAICEKYVLNKVSWKNIKQGYEWSVDKNVRRGTLPCVSLVDGVSVC